MMQDGAAGTSGQETISEVLKKRQAHQTGNIKQMDQLSQSIAKQKEMFGG